MNISNLILDLKSGKELAYKELVFGFSGRLMTVAKIYSSNEEDAKDLIQDAFIIVFKKIKSFQGTQEAAFYGWMKRIVINLALSRNQRKFRKLERSLDTLSIERGIDEKVVSQLSHSEIIKMIFDLPEGYRQVFALYAIEGYSHKEVSQMLDIGESSSRSRYSRARKMLQLKYSNLYKTMTA